MEIECYPSPTSCKYCSWTVIYKSTPNVTTIPSCRINVLEPVSEVKAILISLRFKLIVARGKVGTIWSLRVYTVLHSEWYVGNLSLIAVQINQKFLIVTILFFPFPDKWFYYYLPKPYLCFCTFYLYSLPFLDMFFFPS